MTDRYKVTLDGKTYHTSPDSDAAQRSYDSWLERRPDSEITLHRITTLAESPAVIAKRKAIKDIFERSRKDSETWLDPEEVEPDWTDGSATIEVLYGEGETRRGTVVEWDVLTADLGSFMWRLDPLEGAHSKSEYKRLETLKESPKKCTRCGGDLIDGLAIQNTMSGIGDFHDDDQVATVSAGGSGKLIECLKCQNEMCGQRFLDTGEP